jgi:hypothetical protein
MSYGRTRLLARIVDRVPLGGGQITAVNDNRCTVDSDRIFTRQIENRASDIGTQAEQPLSTTWV